MAHFATATAGVNASPFDGPGSSTASSSKKNCHNNDSASSYSDDIHGSPFSTININQLLSRIQVLETQVAVCVQNQAALFQKLAESQSHCSTRQKLVEQRLAELSKRVDQIIGSVMPTQCLCPCRDPVPSFTTLASTTAEHSPSRNPRAGTQKQPTPTPPSSSVLLFPAPSHTSILPELTLAQAADVLGLGIAGAWEVEEFELVPAQLQVEVMEPPITSTDGFGVAIPRAPAPTRPVQQPEVDPTKQRRRRSKRAETAKRFRLECELCDANYCTWETVALRAHQRKVHGLNHGHSHSQGKGSNDRGMPMGDDDTGPFSCQYCGKSFRDAVALGAHTFWHNVEPRLRRNRPANGSESRNEIGQNCIQPVSEPQIAVADVLSNLSLLYGHG